MAVRSNDNAADPDSEMELRRRLKREPNHHWLLTRLSSVLYERHRRGVLNDIIDDASRDAVFAAFAEALQSNGVLILDVRDWGASLERKSREPLFRKRISTDRGELTFTSITALDSERRQLLISERHELIRQGEERVSDYRFVMRCWERAELDMLLARHSFGKASFFGAYDPNIASGATDRLVVVAQRFDATTDIGLQPSAAPVFMSRRG